MLFRSGRSARRGGGGRGGGDFPAPNPRRGGREPLSNAEFLDSGFYCSPAVQEFIKPSGELGPEGLGIQNIPSSQMSLAHLPFAGLLIQVGLKINCTKRILMNSVIKGPTKSSLHFVSIRF